MQDYVAAHLSTILAALHGATFAAGAAFGFRVGYKFGTAKASDAFKAVEDFLEKPPCPPSKPA
jgi:hypothetical protein